MKRKHWDDLSWNASIWVWTIFCYTKLWHKPNCLFDGKPEETGTFILVAFNFWIKLRDFWFSFGCLWSNITASPSIISLQWSPARDHRLNSRNFCCQFVHLRLHKHPVSKSHSAKSVSNANTAWFFTLWLEWRMKRPVWNSDSLSSKSQCCCHTDYGIKYILYTICGRNLSRNKIT